MSDCPICKDPIKEFDKPRKAHLIIHKAADGHIYTHGDLDSKENLKEMIQVAADDIGIELGGKGNVPAEIVFHNRQRIGDMLVFTCGVRDFKKAFPHVRVNVISVAAHIFDHNPHIDRTLVPTEKNTLKIGPSRLTNASNRIDWHFANAFRYSIEEALGVIIPQGESRPDIYLTQEEYDAPPIFDKPYWIICTSGEKGWGTKMYPHRKWQEVVDQNPDLLFVQIGSAEDNAERLQGKNVIDHVGKTQSKETGIRDLFKLFLNAEGSIGLVSFHMHLSGGLYKPCVVIAGAREPVSFTRYPGHAYLATDGMLPCAATKACWHCAIEACTNIVDRPESIEKKIPKCVDIIDPEEVTKAIRSYYRGGRLIMGQFSPKPAMKGHIVPTPPKVYIPEIPETITAPDMSGVNLYGMSFGGGSLTDRDWQFIRDTMDLYEVKSVLEFGAGLSTLLLNDTGRQVVTYETSQGWIDKIKDFKSGADIRLWDGKNFPGIDDVPVSYDMAFVDGPAGDIGRQVSTEIASAFCGIVVVHDAGREWAKKYQEKYLAGKFDGPFKGGHRCHLWIKKGVRIADVPRETLTRRKAVEAFKNGLKAKEPAKSPIVENGSIKPQQEMNVETDLTLKKQGKKIKIVSTARGWGGCARSVTTIMRMLLAAGHSVEFIPFRNAITSREWQQALAGELKDVKISMDYGTVKESCDVLLMYADDYIWEFDQPAIVEAFSDIGAEKKIMMLNYRRGKVGQVAWTKGWDKYMFLNSAQRFELDKVEDKGARVVLPPCTDLTPFLNVRSINYNSSLRIVRHSSQGDTKFVQNSVDEIEGMINSRPDVFIDMLPGPSGKPRSERYKAHPRTADPKVIAQFLSQGNLFWYSLPYGYMDMGPRVILEAMACGLPVLADAWGGAVDRVTPETGWLCQDKKQFIEIVNDLSFVDLQKKGQAARERAAREFDASAWIREIVY